MTGLTNAMVVHVQCGANNPLRKLVIEIEMHKKYILPLHLKRRMKYIQVSVQ
jgi:hypothetical protein